MDSWGRRCSRGPEAIVTLAAASTKIRLSPFIPHWKVEPTPELGLKLDDESTKQTAPPAG